MLKLHKQGATVGVHTSVLVLQYLFLVRGQSGILKVDVVPTSCFFKRSLSCKKRCRKCYNEVNCYPGEFLNSLVCFVSALMQRLKKYLLSINNLNQSEKVLKLCGYMCVYIYTDIYRYINIDIYMCVCVQMCVFFFLCALSYRICFLKETMP